MRSPLRALLALLVGAGLVFGGAAAPASAYDEGTIHALVNDARAQNGLGGLVRNASLDAVALRWAQQLAANGTLSHNPSVGSEIPAGWTSWGENVAQGYATGSDVHTGWMNSSGHRANILGGFTDIGIALIEGGGTTWAVEVFASYPGSGLPAPAPAPPAPAPAAEPPAPVAAPAPAVAETPAPAATPVPAETTAAEAARPSPAPTERAAAEPSPTAAPQAADARPTPPIGGIAVAVVLGALVAAGAAWWGVAPWLRRRARV